MRRSNLLAVFLVAVCAAPSLPATALAAEHGEPIRIDVDLSEAPRRIFHSRLTLPVTPGPLTLFYPEWIPGEHGPTGPITDAAGLMISAGDRRLPWRRDPLDMYAFHVEVPAGVDRLDIRLDYLLPSKEGRFTAGPAASDRLAVMSWNTLLLYPQGRAPAELRFKPRVRAPAGWKVATALRETGRRDGWIEFEPVSLVTLIDSPVAAGAHHRLFDLTPEGGPPHRIQLFADSEAALDMPAEAHEAYRRLVREGLALFGAHHYREYDFLFTLSDHISHFGLEHHESSDNRRPEETLIDPELMIENAGLLPHEFVHSWNAKYRRPQGLVTADYQEPFVDDLLWVYEGLTSYLGWVLTARSGLWSPEYAREYLASVAAGLAHKPGRSWRPLGDTTRAAQILFGAGQEWSAWRRGVDFYPEGVLIWLEADTRIRRASGGKRSLDDFCRRFYGGQSGPPEVRPFTYEELVEALQEVAALDWDEFFRTWILELAPEPPLGGISGGGWRLVYSDEMNQHLALGEEADDVVDFRFSLGLLLKDRKRHPDHGRLLDVIPGLPAAAAGIAPGMTLVAVNGRAWSREALRQEVRDSVRVSGPLELLVKNAGFYKTYPLDYHGGERYPHLVRDETRADRLSQILEPISR